MLEADVTRSDNVKFPNRRNTSENDDINAEHRLFMKEHERKLLERMDWYEQRGKEIE